MAEVHNLDDGLQEYFEFIIFGHRYRFRQPTTREVMEFSKLKSSEEEANSYLFQFISPVEKTAPKFEETYQKMTVPAVKKFIEMVKTELGS